MIHFDEATHTYTLDDGRVLISVTQLMKKHGLAPDYSSVNPDVLARAAERGTLVHKEIEDYIKTGAIGFTLEMMAFRDYIRDHDLIVEQSEIIAYDDLIAGTIDLILETVDGCQIIADLKTTASLNIEAVSWQLSLYDYLIGYPSDRAQAFHFADGVLKVVDIPFKTHEEVERLIECERNGEIYRRDASLIATEQQLAELAEAEAIIAAAETEKKEAEARAACVKAAIMEAMEKNGVKSFESDRLKLTYVFPTERTTLDSARLKKEMPEIAEKYAKKSKIAASLRITIKE